jgi:DNA-binding MarR family transcriptional regulator
MLHPYEPVRALCGGEARFRLLKALYEDPCKAFHLRGLAAAAGVDPAQVHRLLKHLLAAGLCRRIEDGPFKRYQATTEHPLARALAETFRPAMRQQDPEELEVDLQHAPVLRSLLWTGRKRKRIPAREAFKHYENNWPFIRNAEMEPREKKLLERLKRDYGRGLING